MSRAPEEGEEVLARGHFRVDRKRALEKMEKFQLADPLAYTLELVAAAVNAGATAIAVENDSDDFVIRWEGGGPTRDELDGLFDHLFGAPKDTRGAMLQHLGLGVLGALGQKPRWVHVDRGATDEGPGLRLAVDNPAVTRAVEHAAGPGVRVHVRQRLSFANMAEAFVVPFRGAGEARLLRDRARWCPVPLTLDGKRLAPPAPERAYATVEGPGRLWLVDGRARVDVVRHGIVVASIEHVVGGRSVAGWVPGDGLKLDASRANVVHDDAWTAVERATVEAVARLFAAAADDLGQRVAAAREDAWEAERAQVREIAVWLAGRRRALGAYEGIAFLLDLADRPWSPRDLRVHGGKVGVVDDPALREPGGSYVLFGPEARAALDLLVPGLPDLSAELRARAAGRERRRKAEADRQRPEFSVSHQRRFERGPLRGAVRFEGGDSPNIHVSYRIDGARVEEGTLPSPVGHMAAILDHPGFATDDAFERVLPDETRRAAEAALLEEARAHALDHLARAARGAPQPPSPPAVLASALRAAGARARTDLGALLAAHPDDAILRAPVFACGDGRRLPLLEVLEGSWIVVTTLPPDTPPDLAARVLILPDDPLPIWLAWLRDRARDGRATLPAEISGARRRARPRRQARIAGVSVRVPLDGDVRGELGLTDGREGVEVLRDGVPVCVLRPDLGFSGLVGAVDGPTLPVSLAHDALEPDGEARVTKALVAGAAELARALWDASGAEAPPPERLLSWIAKHGDALPDWALDRPLAVTRDGRAWTARALRAQRQDRRATRVRLVTGDPEDLPGFEDAIRATPALARALGAVAGRAVRDADPDLASARVALASYLGRDAPTDGTPLAERHTTDPGVRVAWRLPATPEAVGHLRVESRWRGRVLSSWERGESLGLLVVVEGEAVRPNAALTMLRDPNLLSPFYKRARAELAELAEPVVDRWERDGVSVLQRETARALLARLERAPDRSRAENALRDRLAGLPLFRRLDGSFVSRTAVEAACDAGEVALLGREVPPGPSDHPWYVHEDGWVVPALGLLASRLAAGGPALAAWRAGEERRRRLTPREARIEGPTLARTALAIDGLTGELGLVRGTDAHADGLVVTPLVDGRPLEAFTIPFPAPAVAVVTGPAVRPDRAFRAWQDATTGPLEAATHALARRVAEELAPWREAGRPDNGPAGAVDQETWLVRYALARAEGPGAQLALFSRLGAPPTDAANLRRIAHGGGIGIVSPGAPVARFVAGEPPVVAPAWLRALLAPHLAGEDLDPVVERHRAPRPPHAPTHAIDMPDGRIAWSAGTDAVVVLREGVTLGVVAPGGIVPLVGYVEDASVEVDPRWRGIEPGPARQKLEAHLRAHARAALEALLAATTGLWPDPSPQRLALQHAVRHVLADHRDEASLRTTLAHDALVAALFGAPLYAGVDGTSGSVLDLLARPTVRAVAPGVVGRPAPKNGPVWRLSEPDRVRLAQLRPVVDATPALAEETLGHARRAANRAPPPAVPPRARSVPLPPPLLGALHLAPHDTDRPVVRVDGANVMPLPVPVVGVGGWVEGDFDVDVAFTTARLDDAAQAAIRGALGELLAKEAVLDPPAVHRRLSVALASVAHAHDGLLTDPLSPWAGVPLLRDAEGEALDLRALLKIRKGHKRLLVGPAGATGTRRGEPVIVGGVDTLALLRAWFPDARVEHVEVARARRDERRRHDEERRAATQVERRERLVLGRASTIWQRWCGLRPPEDAVRAVVRGWVDGTRLGWPPFADADLDGVWPALVAFSVEAPNDTPALRMARSLGLAQALAEAR